MRVTAGCMTSALAMPTRCFIPPESSCILEFANFSSPTALMYLLALSWRSSLGTPATSIPNSTFFWTDLHGNSAKSWNTIPRSEPGPAHSLSPMVIVPLVGWSNPAMDLRMVVFPHPDGPTMEMSSPFFTSRVKSSTATVSDSSVL